jgi:hypothetical protein
MANQGTVLSIDRAANATANLSSLKRLDNLAESIVITANHCSLYENIGGAWQKKDIEGPAFIVRRAQGAPHRLIVLNRISRNSFLIDIHSDFALDLSSPGKYMFRDSGTAVPRTYMIWFPTADVAEGLALMNAFKTLVALSPPAAALPPPPAPAAVPSPPTALAALFTADRPAAASPSPSLLSPSVAALFAPIASGGATPLPVRPAATVASSIPAAPAGGRPAAPAGGLPPAGAASQQTPGSQLAGDSRARTIMRAVLADIFEDDQFMDLVVKKFRYHAALSRLQQT